MNTPELEALMQKIMHLIPQAHIQQNSLDSYKIEAVPKEKECEPGLKTKKKSALGEERRFLSENKPRDMTNEDSDDCRMTRSSAKKKQ